MIRRLLSGSAVPGIGFCIFKREILDKAHESGSIPVLNTTDKHEKFMFAFNPVSYSESYKQRVNVHPTFGGRSAVSDLGVGGNEIRLEIEPHIYTNLPIPYVNDDTGILGVGSTAGTWAKKVAGETIGEFGGFARNGSTELLQLLELLYYCRAKGYKETIKTDVKTNETSTSSNHTYIPKLQIDESINYSDYGYVFYDYDRGRICEVIIDPNGLTVSRSVQDQDTYKISISMTVVRDFGKGTARKMSDVNTFPNPKNIVLGLANGLKDLTKIPGYFAGIVRDIADGVKQLALSGKEVEKAYKDSTKVWSTEMRSIKKDIYTSKKEIANWGGDNKKDPLNSFISKLSYSVNKIQSNNVALLNSYAANMYDVMPGYIEDMFKGTDAVSQYIESQESEIYSEEDDDETTTDSNTGINNLITEFSYPYPSSNQIWTFSYGNEVEIKPLISIGSFKYKIKPARQDDPSPSLPTNGSVTLDENSGKITVKAYQPLSATTYKVLAYYDKDNTEISKQATITISITLDATPITLVSYKPNTESKLLLYKNSFSRFLPELNGTLPMRFDLKSVKDALGVETNVLPNGLILDRYTGIIYGTFDGSFEGEKTVTLLISNSRGQLETQIRFKDDLILPTTITFSHYETPPLPPLGYVLNIKKGDEVNIKVIHNSNSVGFEVTPPLPSGLELDPITGEIKGIGDEIISKDYIFKVSNAKGFVQASIKIIVSSDVTPPTESNTQTDDTTQVEQEEFQSRVNDQSLEIYSQARASYFRLKESTEKASNESLRYLSMYAEYVSVDDKLTISPIFAEAERYEVINDFNYLYLLGALEFYVNFKAQFKIAESEDRFIIYQPTSAENFYDIAKKFYGNPDYAIDIATYNNVPLNKTDLPPTLLLPIENSMNLNIVNRISDFQPPYSLDRIKNELLGYDLKLTQDRDFAVTINGDLDLISGENSIIESITDILSVPQGSILSDPVLGNPVYSEGEVIRDDEVFENSINLGSIIMREPRIKDTTLLSTEQDGDTIIYSYSVKTITDKIFTLEIS